MSKCALMINPAYRFRRSKTGELDETLQVSRHWVDAALQKFVKKRVGSERLWPFTAAQMRVTLARITLDLLVTQLAPVLYSARHTGASIDRLENRIPLSEVQARGRWRSDASVRRYEKRALVQKVASLLSSRQKVLFAKDLDELPGRLLRSV